MFGMDNTQDQVIQDCSNEVSVVTNGTYGTYFFSKNLENI